MSTGQNDEKLIFKAASELKTPAEQTAYVERVCAADPVLKERILSLLEADEDRGDFLEALLDDYPISSDDLELEEKSGTVIGRYKLLEKIKSRGKRYNAILCPLKGGFYLSYFLHRHLELPIYFIEISSYEGKKQREFIVGIKHELKSGCFLLCDDIYDSGETVDKIHTIYPDISFDIFCLISKKRNSDIEYVDFVDKDVWVDFFWEVM